MSPVDEMISLLQTFDPIADTTGQSWADVGLGLCRDTLAKFTKDDWADFDIRKDDLTNEQRLLLADLSRLVPKQHCLPILTWLVSTTRGASWVASAEVLGDWLLKEPEVVELYADQLRNEDVVRRFEEELSGFINYPRSPEAFDEYLARYSHLVSPGTIELYASVKGSHNNALQPTCEDARG